MQLQLLYFHIISCSLLGHKWRNVSFHSRPQQQLPGQTCVEQQCLYKHAPLTLGICPKRLSNVGMYCARPTRFGSVLTLGSDSRFKSKRRREAAAARSGRGSAYLEVVVKVPGFVLPGVAGRRGPLEKSRGVAENHHIIVTTRFRLGNLGCLFFLFFSRLVRSYDERKDSHNTDGSERNTQIFDNTKKPLRKAEADRG